jgi:integrase
MMIKAYKHKSKTYYKVQLSITDPNTGKRHQPKFRTDQKGQRFSSYRLAEQAAFKRRMEEEARLSGDCGHLSFKEYRQKFLNCIKTTHKNSTIMQYDGDLKKWLTPDLEEKEIRNITKHDIYDFIFETMPSRGKVTAHTQKRICRNLRRIFQAAVEDGGIPRNPVSGIKIKVAPSKKRVLNTKEAEKLLLEGKDSNHPFYFHWAFALLSGMRSGELYALRWSDIDEVSGIITIKSSWSKKDGYHSTKSNQNRVCPISKELSNLLLELRNIGPFSEDLGGKNDDSLIFDDLVLPRRKEWQYGNQAKVLGEFCEMIGLEPVKFHDLRATFITNLLAQGVSLPKVMSIVAIPKQAQQTSIYGSQVSMLKAQQISSAIPFPRLLTQVCLN